MLKTSHSYLHMHAFELTPISGSIKYSTDCKYCYFNYLITIMPTCSPNWLTAAIRLLLK